MYKSFDLSIGDNDFRDFYNHGLMIHLENKKKVKQEFDLLHDDNGDLSASKIFDEWFPSIDADIFLSHSHKDERKIISLSGWLDYKFKIKSFIDSCVWGYSDDLLRAIDDKYCYKPDSGTYSYEKRNKSTAHVYVMLSTALARMIDSCESVFFVNTPNSISSSECIGGVDETLSPWIYSEIAMTGLVRERSLSSHRSSLVKKSMVLEGIKSLNVRYGVNLDHLIKLNYYDLIKWGDVVDELIGDYNPLDVLYCLNGVNNEFRK